MEQEEAGYGEAVECSFSCFQNIVENRTCREIITQEACKVVALGHGVSFPN